MQNRTLGRTGITVSPFALGAMMFGAVGNPDHEASVAVIRRALDAGITLIDTADMYSHGESEVIVGKAIAGRRDDVVLATKFGLPMGPENMGGGSRRWIMRAVEDSLQRLGTDYIDLYQIHRPDPTTDVDETLGALSDLVRQGKVRAIGSSSMLPGDIVEAQVVAERRGHERFRVEQPTYSILNRRIEEEVLPVVERHGMGAIVYSPLAGGMLTGRYRRGQQADTHRSSVGFGYLTDERMLDAVESLIALADEAGIRLPHLALAFAIAHPGVTSAILGPRTMEQLDDLLAGVDTVLDDDLLDRIDAIVAPGTDVRPLDMVWRGTAVQDAALRRRPAGSRSAA